MLSWLWASIFFNLLIIFFLIPIPAQIPYSHFHYQLPRRSHLSSHLHQLKRSMSQGAFIHLPHWVHWFDHLSHKYILSLGGNRLAWFTAEYSNVYWTSAHWMGGWTIPNTIPILEWSVLPRLLTENSKFSFLPSPSWRYWATLTFVFLVLGPYLHF